MTEKLLAESRRRWIGLVRVSSDDQDGGAGTQLGGIGDWVEGRGDILVATFTDEVEGTIEHLHERHAISAAWSACARKEADGIVVYRLDRLARDIELQEMLLRECRNRRIVVASCNAEEERLLECEGGADPTRTLIRVILGAVAQYERSVIKLRTRAGIGRAQREGRWLGGRLPYGQALDSETGKLVINPVEARIIGQGLTLRAMGCTLEEVGEFFLQAGMKPRLAKTRTHRNETVRVILAGAKGKGIAPAALSALAEQFAGSRAEIIAAQSAQSVS